MHQSSEGRVILLTQLEKEWKMLYVVYKPDTFTVWDTILLIDSSFLQVMCV